MTTEQQEQLISSIELFGTEVVLTPQAIARLQSITIVDRWGDKGFFDIDFTQTFIVAQRYGIGPVRNEVTLYTTPSAKSFYSFVCFYSDILIKDINTHLDKARPPLLPPNSIISLKNNKIDVWQWYKANGNHFLYEKMQQYK